jgi:hypothetical protein
MEKENERQHQETRALVSTESEAGRDYETIPRITGA